MDLSRDALIKRAAETANRAKEGLLRRIAGTNVDDTNAHAFGNFVASWVSENYSQFSQDLFVAWVFGEMEGGGFIEFGAADGITHSNSLMLESRLGWHGILVEPYRYQFRMLQQNRPESLIVRAAFRTSNDRVASLACAGQLSSMLGFHDRDFHKDKRAAVIDAGRIESCPTIDLGHLCSAYFSDESQINYMSVDVEGAELAILSRFDFRLKPGVVTIEYNDRIDDKEALVQLMHRHGYKQAFPSCDHICGPELWFVRGDVFAQRFDAGA